MMRSATLMIALAIASVGSAVRAQDLESSARMFSELTALRASCPAYMPINDVFIAKAIDGVMEKAWKTHGEAQFEGALEKEVPRRKAEVDATGAVHWCRYHRGYLQGLGLGAAFKR